MLLAYTFPVPISGLQVLTRGWRSALRRDATEDANDEDIEHLSSGEIWVRKCTSCADVKEMLMLIRYVQTR
jgi:hypothetical protein